MNGWTAALAPPATRTMNAKDGMEWKGKDEEARGPAQVCARYGHQMCNGDRVLALLLSNTGFQLRLVERTPALLEYRGRGGDLLGREGVGTKVANQKLDPRAAIGAVMVQLLTDRTTIPRYRTQHQRRVLLQPACDPPSRTRERAPKNAGTFEPKCGAGRVAGREQRVTSPFSL